MRSLVVLVALCACGDDLQPIGDPLRASRDLVVVAHQDDDLYFMQPDLLEAVQRGEGITSVYVTAGDNAQGMDYAMNRYAGLRYAYGAAAGSLDWRCGVIAIATHVVEHCHLADRPVSLVFLAYPDGGVDGEFAHSLLKLWQGDIASAETVAEQTTTYTQDELIETVAEIVRETQPGTIHTLEVASTHGRDHTDHMIVGAITLLAMARANSHADVISYRGYSVLTEPVNKAPAMLSAVTDMVQYYEACTSTCGTCGSTCPSVLPSHVAWFAHRYAVGFRRAVEGRVQTDAGCLDGDLEISACDAAPSWRVVDGAVQLGDRCLEVSATGEVALAACAPGPAQRFFVDDEGHVWSAVVPAPDPAMAFAHLWCVAPNDAGGIGARLCGRDQGAPSWTFAPPTVTTARASLGLAAIGRAVHLGDVDGDGRADLCAVETGMITCASGDGAGSFVSATPRFAVTFDPMTLVLGDVDGDGRADACGRDASGIVCAVSAQSFAQVPWPGAATSLAVVDRNVCGFGSNGVECATRTATQILSTWPAADALVWPADLDGDGPPDWCASTAAGPACGVAAESAISTDGTAWSFSLGGVADSGSLGDATTAFADLDGDGRADLCSLDAGVVSCARSQGRGFGPRAVAAIVPDGATALWLGDLDGDGRADACVELGDRIVCAVR